MNNLGANFIDSINEHTPKNSKKINSKKKGQFFLQGFGPKVLEFKHSIEGYKKIKQIYTLLFLLALIFLSLFARVFTIQIVKGDQFLNLSENNRIRVQILRAPRGVITDRYGEVIARNKPGFSVVFSTGFGGFSKSEKPVNKQGEISYLAKLLGISKEEIAEKINDAVAKGLPQAEILSNLGRDKAIEIESKILNLDLVSLEISPVREYLYPFAFSHLVGYVSEINAAELERLSKEGYFAGDKIGKTGIEKTYDRNLHGEAGGRLYEVDASASSFKVISERQAKIGDEIKLAVDLGLQVKAFNALNSGVEKSKASGGAVVAQDVKTGELLALVSFPSFDANKFAEGISNDDYQSIIEDLRRPLFNRAISASYPPGSTFKMVTAAASLEEGVIFPDTKIKAPGAINIGEFTYSDWKPEGHGAVNMYEALGESADTYFYKVGGGYGDVRGVGVDNLHKWALAFGLGEPTGIDIESEAEGLVPSREWKLKVKGEQWFLGNTYHFAIGQGDILVTPLQLNNITAAIANGGNLLRPSVLKEDGSSRMEVGDEGLKLEDRKDRVIRSGFVSQETLAVIREGMKMACDPGGTAYPLYDLKGIEVGCKTGTSEFGILEEGKTHAWLTLFAPFDDPKIAITVFLEGGGEGSHDAGPVMREIVDWLVNERSEFIQPSTPRSSE